MLLILSLNVYEVPKSAGFMVIVDCQREGLFLTVAELTSIPSM